MNLDDPSATTVVAGGKEGIGVPAPPSAAAAASASASADGSADSATKAAAQSPPDGSSGGSSGGDGGDADSETIFSHAEGLALDPARGRVLVCDKKSQSIKAVYLDTQHVETVHSFAEDYSPLCVTVAPEGDGPAVAFVVANSPGGGCELLRLDMADESNPVETVFKAEFMRGVTVSPVGELVVCSVLNAKKKNSQTSLLLNFGPTSDVKTDGSAMPVTSLHVPFMAHAIFWVAPADIGLRSDVMEADTQSDGTCAVVQTRKHDPKKSGMARVYVWDLRQGRVAPLDAHYPGRSYINVTHRRAQHQSGDIGRIHAMCVTPAGEIVLGNVGDNGESIQICSRSQYHGGSSMKPKSLTELDELHEHKKKEECVVS